MSFAVAADAYAQYMGRYADPLAVMFADSLDLRDGQTALDVGCGPGALTAQLVQRLGSAAVTGIDPSASFVAAAHGRFPDVDIRLGVAESLPFGDAAFDVTAAQLVVHFMSDPVGGLRQMARVTRPGGVVAANVWDHAGGLGPLSVLWQAARDLDPEVHDESGLAGAHEGHLAELFGDAGLVHVESYPLTVTVAYPGFDDWWSPMMLGVGPGGAYVGSLDEAARAALRARCAELLPSGGAFEITATAWTAKGIREGR